MTTTASPRTTESVARELVDLCRTGKNMDAISKLYSPDIVSIEAQDFEGMPARATGLDAIRFKNQWWIDNVEVHGHEVDGPYLNGDEFAIRYTYDTSNKKTGVRAQNMEIAVYTVKNGLVVQERFYQETRGS